MRTNFAGFFLAAGMGLIVVLLGFGALSLAGLVGFAGEEIEAQPGVCGNVAASTSQFISNVDTIAASAYVPTSVQEAVALADGDALFKANCAQCHAIAEKVVGPALMNVTNRRPVSWLIPWIKNSSKVIAAGDDYAIKIFNDNGKQQMPSFKLTDKQITNILLWIKTQEPSIVVSN